MVCRTFCNRLLCDGKRVGDLLVFFSLKRRDYRFTCGCSSRTSRCFTSTGVNRNTASPKTIS